MKNTSTKGLVSIVLHLSPWPFRRTCKGFPQIKYSCAVENRMVVAQQIGWHHRTINTFAGPPRNRHFSICQSKNQRGKFKCAPNQISFSYLNRPILGHRTSITISLSMSNFLAFRESNKTNSRRKSIACGNQSIQNLWWLFKRVWIACATQIFSVRECMDARKRISGRSCMRFSYK